MCSALCIKLQYFFIVGINFYSKNLYYRAVVNLTKVNNSYETQLTAQNLRAIYLIKVINYLIVPNNQYSHMRETQFLCFSYSDRIFVEHLYIFLPLNVFISIYAICNFYCDIFLLVHAEQGLNQYFIFIF